MSNQPALSLQTIAAIKVCAVSVEDMGKGIAILAKIINGEYENRNHTEPATADP